MKKIYLGFYINEDMIIYRQIRFGIEKPEGENWSCTEENYPCICIILIVFSQTKP